MTWAEEIKYDGSAIITVGGDRSKAKLRYPIVGINELRSIDKVFICDADFRITPKGEIEWLGSNAPASGTRLSFHGTIHPHWIVMDHVNTYRDTFIEGGGTGLALQKREKLPVQAMVKLDYLVDAE